MNNYHVPHETFVRSLQSQIAHAANKINRLEDEVVYLKYARLVELERYGKGTNAWLQISDDIDTLKRSIKRLAEFQKNNKQLMKYLYSKQQEIRDIRKAEEQLIWE